MKVTRFRHLRWEIQDHIKDAEKHYEFALHEKEDGDLKASKEQQMKGFSRVQKAKESLGEFSDYLRDCEYRDKHSSMDVQDISDKYCAWRMLSDEWEHDIEELEEKFNDLKI